MFFHSKIFAGVRIALPLDPNRATLNVDTVWSFFSFFFKNFAIVEDVRLTMPLSCVFQTKFSSSFQTLSSIVFEVEASKHCVLIYSLLLDFL
jgi:hypothetical protein